MGLIRKAASLSTGGAVKYTSRRDAQTKAAAAEGRLAREQTKLAKAQRKTLAHGAAPVASEPAAPAAQHDHWYEEPTLGSLLRRRNRES
jgi:hypothetical protein